MGNEQQNQPFPKTPVPAPAQQINKKPEEFDFLEALKRTIKGAKITRLAWETNDVFGQMVNDQLHIFIGGEFKSWTLVPGDIEATDWIELPVQTKE